MKQQPDKIFRDKLAHFERQPSDKAWTRIDDGLDRKKPLARWWYAAAAILVVAVSIYLAVPTFRIDESAVAVNSGNQPGKQNESEDTSTPKVNEPAVQTGPLKDQENITSADTYQEKTSLKRRETLARDKRSQTRPAEYSVTRDTHDDKIQTAQEPIISAENIPTLANNAEEEVKEEGQPNMNDPHIRNAQSITIVMSAKDTDKYLRKNLNDEATSPEKKSSTLQRVLRKASELKNNDEDPLGDLRQMKNEILALNFKSEKQREQKQVN